MRVTITSNASEFVLVSGLDVGQFTEALDIDQEEQVEPGLFLRATKSKQFARGNTQTLVTFTVTRTHADARTCEEYILTHAASIPKVGDVRFIAESATGQSTKKLSDASLAGCRHRQVGCSSIHEYRFKGGDFEAVTT